MAANNTEPVIIDNMTPIPSTRYFRRRSKWRLPTGSPTRCNQAARLVLSSYSKVAGQIQPQKIRPKTSVTITGMSAASKKGG